MRRPIGPRRSSSERRSRVAAASHQRECPRRCADRWRRDHTPPVSWHIRRGRRPAGDMRSGLSPFRPRWFRGTRPCCPECRLWLRDDRQHPLLPRRGLYSLGLPTLHAQPPRLGFPADRRAGKASPALGRELSWPASLAPGSYPESPYRQLRKRACHWTSYATVATVGAGQAEPSSRPCPSGFCCALPPFDGRFPHMLHSTFQEVSERPGTRVDPVPIFSRREELAPTRSAFLGSVSVKQLKPMVGEQTG